VFVVHCGQQPGTLSESVSDHEGTGDNPHDEIQSNLAFLHLMIHSASLTWLGVAFRPQCSIRIARAGSNLMILATLKPARPSSPQPLVFFTQEFFQRFLVSGYYVATLSFHGMGMPCFTVMIVGYVSLCVDGIGGRWPFGRSDCKTLDQVYVS